MERTMPMGRGQRRARRAFTLVEVLITLGIISISIVGILALFPVALKTSLESRTETRFALMAQTVFSDLRTGGFTRARLVRGPDGLTDFEEVDLSLAGRRYVLMNANGIPLRALTEEEFNASILDADGQFVALLDIEPLPSIGARLSRISLHLADPSTLPHARRTLYPFVSIIRETSP